MLAPLPWAGSVAWADRGAMARPSRSRERPKVGRKRKRGEDFMAGILSGSNVRSLGGAGRRIEEWLRRSAPLHQPRLRRWPFIPRSGRSTVDPAKKAPPDSSKKE